MSFWSRMKNALKPSPHFREIEEELEFHLEMDQADGRDRQEALQRLGRVSRVADETRKTGTFVWLELMLLDLRYGLRQLRKSPALSLAIIASLAIGFGTNVGIFALLDAALLKPLPVSDPDRLVLLEWGSEDGFAALQETGVQRMGAAPRFLDGGGMQFRAVSEAVYRGFASEQSTFSEVIGFSSRSPMAIAEGGAPPERVGVQYVSANFFSGLGVGPIVGRSFLVDEDRRGQEPAVVLSHRFWMSRLGGDPDVFGRNLRVNDVSVRVVGVAPPGFFGLTIGEWVDVYVPLSARPALEAIRAASPPPGGENADWWIQQAARLPAGVSASGATAQSAGLFRSVVAESTGTGLQAGLELTAERGRRGVNAIGNNANEARALAISMVLVAVLLLIVCANVATLLLSRSIAKQRESAVRLALGARRIQLLRQNLIGSGILAVIGGFVGLVMGYLLAHLIHELFQSGQGAGSAFALQLDWRVFTFTSLIGVAMTLAFGLAPAIRASVSELSDTLRVQTRSVIGGRLRLPRFLVSMQFALCFAALVAAGLLARSLGNLNSVDLGYDPEHLAYATVDPYQIGYTPDEIQPFLDRLKRGLEAIPGVVAVSVLDNRPLQGGGRETAAFTPEGPVPLDDGRPSPAATVNLGIGGHELLETLGVQLLAGRGIEPNDDPEAPVAVVDQRFADVFFRGRNPLGERFDMLGQSIEVVGLAANVRFLDLREETTPTVYLPFDPSRFLPGEIHFAIRAAIGTDQLAADVRRAVATVDANLPISEFFTQTGLINRELRAERLLAFLSGGFGLIALALAAIGLGGLLAYAVARRTGEIGVRMALGAAPTDVVRIVLRDATAMSCLGILIGLPLAYGVARTLQSSLFELGSIDPLTTVFALTVLLLVALIAAWLPAQRAAHVNPVVALRDE